MLKVDLKDLLTLGNAVSGIVGISLAIAGQGFAWLYIFPAIVFDFLDGRVARKTKPNEFGKELDSLADTVSFVVAPAVVAMFGQLSLVLTIASAFYVCCGLWRLAKFNLQSDKKHYYGLPSPLAALATLVFNLVLPGFVWLAFIATAVAMVIPIKVKKL